MAEKHGWENLGIWKIDLRGAFHLLDVKPKCVPLLAMELTGGTTAFMRTGFFGWTGLPMAFGVITRILVRAMMAVIVGMVLGYVDNFFGCSPKVSLKNDMEKAIDTVKKLLGPDTHAEDKDEFGEVVDVLGWSVDLRLRKLSLSKRNLLKLSDAFMHTDLSKPISVRVVQKLASLATRYSIIIPVLKPLSGILYHATVGLENKNALVTMTVEFVEVIGIWRHLLIALALDENISRAISSIIRRRNDGRPVYQITFDGCPRGVGVLVESVPDQEVVAWCSCQIPFETYNKPEFQNLAETAAAAIGMAIVGEISALGAHVDLVAIAHGHITSEANKVCDQLSRGIIAPFNASETGPH